MYYWFVGQCAIGEHWRKINVYKYNLQYQTYVKSQNKLLYTIIIINMLVIKIIIKFSRGWYIIIWDYDGILPQRYKWNIRRYPLSFCPQEIDAVMIWYVGRIAVDRYSCRSFLRRICGSYAGLTVDWYFCCVVRLHGEEIQFRQGREYASPVFAQGTAVCNELLVGTIHEYVGVGVISVGIYPGI